MSLNTVSLLARITNEPELRVVGDDKKVTELRVAYNYRGKASFFNVEVWGNAAERAVAHGKGGLVVIGGRLSMEEWTDKNDARQERVKIVASSLRTVANAPTGAEDAAEADEASTDPLEAVH